MYKNAEIKSEREAIERLMNGEVFYYKGEAIMYSTNEHSSPFIIGGGILRNDALFYYGDWEMKDWTSSLPILCWVWDDYKGAAFVKIVTRKDKYYVTQDGSKYYNAAPLTKEEIQVLLDKAGDKQL